MTSSETGNTASLPASGSRQILEKKPDAALFGVPGRTQTVGNLNADAVEHALPSIIGQQQFADRLSACRSW